MFDEAREAGMGHDLAIRHMQATLEEAAEEGLIDPRDPNQLARAWLAIIVGGVALHRAGILDEPALRDLCRRAAGRVLDYGMPVTATLSRT
jgi:hypothetical protein